MVGAALTYIGAALMLFMGVSLPFEVRDGAFMGEPMDVVRIAGAPIPIGVVPTAGVIFAIIGVALAVLAVAAQRGHPAGQLGLTVIGALVIVGLGYTFFTADDISPLPPTAWIATALTLLWVGKKQTAK